MRFFTFSSPYNSSAYSLHLSDSSSLSVNVLFYLSFITVLRAVFLLPDESLIYFPAFQDSLISLFSIYLHIRFNHCSFFSLHFLFIIRTKSWYHSVWAFLIFLLSFTDRKPSEQQKLVSFNYWVSVSTTSSVDCLENWFRKKFFFSFFLYTRISYKTKLKLLCLLKYFFSNSAESLVDSSSAYTFLGVL